MILIQMPLKREEVITLLNGATYDGYTFHYLKQERMKLYFEVNGNQQHATEIADKVIKNSQWGKALFYHIDYEE